MPNAQQTLEPWMRGTITGVDPVLAALLYSFEHAREDLEKWTDGLSDEALWMQWGESGSVGFHIRHIAGSIDRLLTYAQGEQLSGAQLAELKTEKEGGISRDELLAVFNQKIEVASQTVRQFDPARFAEERFIGRKRIPVTLAGILVHAAEHTQRHVGEAIITSKIVRQQAG